MLEYQNTKIARAAEGAIAQMWRKHHFPEDETCNPTLHNAAPFVTSLTQPLDLQYRRSVSSSNFSFGYSANQLSLFPSYSTPFTSSTNWRLLLRSRDEVFSEGKINCSIFYPEFLIKHGNLALVSFIFIITSQNLFRINYSICNATINFRLFSCILNK